MERGYLASKKNVILLASTLLFIVLALASYYIKQLRIEKETWLGGQVEIMHEGPLPRPERHFVKDHTLKLTYVADMKLELPLPKGPFVSYVRGFDVGYPLRGDLQINRMGNRDLFIADPEKKLYGVAVNQVFLDRSGMKIGERFAMNHRLYELRGVIESVPDTSGWEMSHEPLLMLESRAEVGNGMWMVAQERKLRYFMIMKQLSPWQFKSEFFEQFPDSKAIITKASDAKPH